MFTTANIDDRFLLKQKKFHDKIAGDKGYIEKDLSKSLFVDGIHLITKVRKNIKNKVMDFMGKVTLRKRAVLKLKLLMMCSKTPIRLVHSRDRSFDNFITNMISDLIAYSFLPKKPSIKVPNMVTQ